MGDDVFPHDNGIVVQDAPQGGNGTLGQDRRGIRPRKGLKLRPFLRLRPGNPPQVDKAKQLFWEAERIAKTGRSFAGSASSE